MADDGNDDDDGTMFMLKLLCIFSEAKNVYVQYKRNGGEIRWRVSQETAAEIL